MDVFTLRRNYEAARKQRALEICGDPAEFTYVPEQCRPKRSRSAKKPAKAKRSRMATDKKLQKLLRKTRKDLKAHEHRELDARRAALNQVDKSGIHPSIQQEFRTVFDSMAALPRFIAFVVKRFNEPGMAKKYPDLEKRYEAAVNLYKGPETIEKWPQVKLAVLELVAESARQSKTVGGVNRPGP